MFIRWLTGRGAHERDVARQAERLTAQVWQTTVNQHGFLQGLNATELEALRQRTAWLLASKSFNAAGGLQLNDNMLLSIAVQAALPILGLHPEVYEGWHEIIVYPSGFLVPRSEMDEAGVVHESLQEVAGEAWEGGPLVLSWEDAGARAGHSNVVIHEFAHKIDLHYGVADGLPDLSHHSELQPLMWRQILEESFQQFCATLEQIEAAIPAHIDPESPAADPWYDTLPLDPYAATDLAEFFAVSSEGFFIDPEPLRRDLPQWYSLLARFYRQDPWARLHTL